MVAQSIKFVGCLFVSSVLTVTTSALNSISLLYQHNEWAKNRVRQVRRQGNKISQWRGSTGDNGYAFSKQLGGQVII